LMMSGYCQRTEVKVSRGRKTWLEYLKEDMKEL